MVAAGTGIAALVLVAWLARGDADPSASPDDRAADGVPSARSLIGSGKAELGDRISPLAVTTLDGEEFGLPTGKPTAVFFTASYCASCVPKAEAFDRIHREVGDRVAILGVDVDPTDSEPAFRKWIELVGNPRYDFAMDRDGQLGRAFDVIALSTVVILDPDGEIVYRSAGGGGEQDFRRAFAEAGL